MQTKCNTSYESKCVLGNALVFVIQSFIVNYCSKLSFYKYEKYWNAQPFMLLLSQYFATYCNALELNDPRCKLFNNPTGTLISLDRLYSPNLLHTSYCQMAFVDINVNPIYSAVVQGVITHRHNV